MVDDRPAATNAAEHLRLHRLGRLAKIDADPELRAWIEARILGATFEALADQARAAFGPDRAPSSSAVYRYWQRHRERLLAEHAAGDDDDAGGADCPSCGRPLAAGLMAAPYGAPEPHRACRVGCFWCGELFAARQSTGGGPKRFCGDPCRMAFHRAARRWVAQAIADGRLTVAEIKEGTAADDV